VPSKPFGTIRSQHRRTEARTALDAVVMRSDLLDRMKVQLEAWIKSKGFECPDLPKYRLRGYALSIWDYLTGRQHKQTILSNLPLGTPTIQDRGDLDKLRWDELRRWIQSKGFSSPSGSKTETLLLLAQRIWDCQEGRVDKQSLLNNPGGMIAVVQDRKDIDKLRVDDLKIWIKSKGFSIALRRKADLLSRAQKIWNLEGRHPPANEIGLRIAYNGLVKHPQTREDLHRMLRDDLKGWIWSKGHTCGKRHTKKRLLARAQEVWDILERDDPSRLTGQEDFSRKPAATPSPQDP